MSVVLRSWRKLSKSSSSLTSLFLQSWRNCRSGQEDFVSVILLIPQFGCTVVHFVGALLVRGAKVILDERVHHCPVEQIVHAPVVQIISQEAVRHKLTKSSWMYQFPEILEMVVHVVMLVPPGCALQRTIEQVVDVQILQIMNENINREGRS